MLDPSPDRRTEFLPLHHKMALAFQIPTLRSRFLATRLNLLHVQECVLEPRVA